MRATVMEVSKKEFINNIKKIKDYVGSKEILPVIKDTTITNANIMYTVYINSPHSII